MLPLAMFVINYVIELPIHLYDPKRPPSWLVPTDHST